MNPNWPYSSLSKPECHAHFVNAFSSLLFKFVWNPLVLNGSCAILSAGKPRGLCVTIGVNQRPGLATMSQCCELGEIPLKTNSCWIGIGWEYNGNTMDTHYIIWDWNRYIAIWNKILTYPNFSFFRLLKLDHDIATDILRYTSSKLTADHVRRWRVPTVMALNS